MKKYDVLLTNKNNDTLYHKSFRTLHFAKKQFNSLKLANNGEEKYLNKDGKMLMLKAKSKKFKDLTEYEIIKICQNAGYCSMCPLCLCGYGCIVKSSNCDKFAEIEVEINL